MEEYKRQQKKDIKREWWTGNHWLGSLLQRRNKRK